MVHINMSTYRCTNLPAQLFQAKTKYGTGTLLTEKLIPLIFPLHFFKVNSPNSQRDLQLIRNKQKNIEE